MEHRGLAAPGGGGPAGTDKDRFRRDLAAVDAHLRLHYRLMVILFVCLFVLGIGVVLLFIDDPKHASAVIAAVGVGAGGAVKRLGDTGREIAKLRLVTALSEGLSGEQLGVVIQALIARVPR
jgi:hypothetical protein